MRVLAILQARMSSSRLPGKVLLPVLGRPMLELQLERVRRATSLDHLVVATSVDPSDDPLVAFCEKVGVDVKRGNLQDVLDRYYQVAVQYQPEHVVRLTGDCPLADPEVIDDLVNLHRAGGFDYSSNVRVPTFPHGLDAEICTFAALQSAWQDAKLPSEREHVTYYIYQHPERYRIGSLQQTVDLSGYRWTVDERADYQLVRRIYEALYPANPAFTTENVIRLYQSHPELRTVNAGHERGEGLRKSLAQDEEFLRTRTTAPTRH